MRKPKLDIRKAIYIVSAVAVWLTFAYLFKVSAPWLGLITAVLFVTISLIFLKELSERRIPIKEIIDYEEFRKSIRDESGDGEDKGESIREGGGLREFPRFNGADGDLQGKNEQQRDIPSKPTRIPGSNIKEPGNFEQYTPID